MDPQLNHNSAPVCENAQVDWLGEAGLLTRRALAGFLKVAAAMIALGVVLAAMCVWVIPQGWALRTLGASVVILACLIEGVWLGLQNAWIGAAIEAVRRYRLAGRIVETIFDHVIARAGRPVAGVLQRLPLARAESLLRQCPERLTTETAGGGLTGFLFRRVRAGLTKRVQRLMLAEFRQANVEHGGIDLEAIRRRLAAECDQRVQSQLQRGIRRLVFLVAVATTVAALTLALALRQASFHL